MGTFDIQNMQKLLSIRQSSLTLSINPLCSNKCQFLTIFPNRMYVQCCSDFFFICNISDRRFLSQQSNRKALCGSQKTCPVPSPAYGYSQPVQHTGCQGMYSCSKVYRRNTMKCTSDLHPSSLVSFQRAKRPGSYPDDCSCILHETVTV